MSDQPNTRSIWPVAIVVACVLAIALVAAWNVRLFQTPIFEQGDAAVNGLQIDNAKHLREIYGNYSRFEFNHPGPVFFYFYAFAEVVFHDGLGLTPAPHNAHLLASLLLQIAFFAVALAILDHWFASRYLLLAALVGAAWHFSSTTGAFTSIWPPHVLLMPFLCFLTAACSIAAGRLRDLPILAVAGGFLFHGHVAQPLFVGGIGGLALVMHWRTCRLGMRDWRSELRDHRGTLWFCLAWAVLLVLPLAIDVLRYGSEGNVATILGRFRSNADHGKSIVQSLLYFLSFSTYAVNQEDVLTRLNDATLQFFADHSLNLVLWTTAIAVPAALFYKRRSSIDVATRRFVAGAYFLLAVTIALCVVWGLLQAGPMYQFNGFFYYGIYFFAAVLSAGVLLTLFAPPPKPVLLTVGFCIATIGFTHGFLAPGLSSSDAGQDVREAVEKMLREHPDPRAKLLVFEHLSWPEAGSILLELQRRGIPFYTAHSWNFMFGRQHDVLQLGDTPERSVDVWWLAPAGEGGVPVKRGLSLFAQPTVVDPQGTTVGFGFRQKSYRMVLSGLTTGNVDSARSDKPSVRFAFTAKPTRSDVQLIFDVATWNSTSQRVQVLWNGQAVGELVATAARAQPTITIPAALWNSAAKTTILELRLPDAVPITDPVRPGLHNTDAIRLWHLWFASAAMEKIEPAESGIPLQLSLTDRAPIKRAFTETINPTGDRLDFSKGNRGTNLAATGLGAPTSILTPIEDTHAAILFRALPATDTVLLEIVAEPYTTGSGKPAHQRCQLLFNGQLIFDAPFTEPGVIRAAILKEMWNARPFAVIQLLLPDATPADAPPGSPRQGLALRWLTARPATP